MKKLSRTSLSALKNASIVLTEQQQRAVKGGCSLEDMGVGYWSGNNYYWYRTSECTCGSGGYGLGEYGSGGYGSGGYNSGGYGGYYGYMGNGSSGGYGHSDGGYWGQGTKDCALQAIASITGLSVEKVWGYAADVIQHNLNVSEGYAQTMAGLPLSESDIEAVLQKAGGGCYEVDLNKLSSTTFNNSIGLINGHVVRVTSYDSSTGTVHWIDPQNNNKTGSDSSSSFHSIKSSQEFNY